MIAYSSSRDAFLEITSSKDGDRLHISQRLDTSPFSLSIICGDQSIGNEDPSMTSPITILNSPEELEQFILTAKVTLFRSHDSSDQRKFLTDPVFCSRYRDIMRGKTSDWYLYAVSVLPGSVKLYYTQQDSGSFEVVHLPLSSTPLRISLPSWAPRISLANISDATRLATEIKICDTDSDDWRTIVMIEEPRNSVDPTDRVVHRYYPLEGENIPSILNRSADDGYNLRW